MPRLLPILALLCLAAAPATQPVRDDAPGLQRLLNRSNAVVTITPRAYSTASPIVLTNVHDLVVFAHGVTLNADPKQPVGVRIGDSLRLEHCQRVTVLGMGINGNRAARGGFQNDSQAVHLLSSDDVTLRDCDITGAVCDGVFAWGGFNPATAELVCHRVHVEHCRIGDVGRSCVSLVGAAWSSVTDCDLSDAVTSNPGCGVDVEANVGDPDGVLRHITLSGNRAWNLRGGGFYVIKTGPAPTGVIIAGNQIDQTQWDAIANYGLGTIITGNNITNCARAGISNLLPGTMRQSGNNATVYQQ